MVELVTLNTLSNRPTPVQLLIVPSVSNILSFHPSAPPAHAHCAMNGKCVVEP